MSSASLPQLPDSGCGGGSGSVPVFSCIIILRPDAPTGRIYGEVANLPGLSAEGVGERDLLILLTKRFRSVVQEYVRQNRTIPWIDPPRMPGEGELQRFIPVHL